MSAFPKKFHLSSEIFFSHRPFSCFSMVFFHRGDRSVADIDTGGPNSLTFQQNHNTTIAFSVPKGAKLHCQFRWGAMAGFAPLDPPLTTDIDSKVKKSRELSADESLKIALRFRQITEYLAVRCVYRYIIRLLSVGLHCQTVSHYITSSRSDTRAVLLESCYLPGRL